MKTASRNQQSRGKPFHSVLALVCYVTVPLSKRDAEVKESCTHMGQDPVLKADG